MAMQRAQGDVLFTRIDTVVLEKSIGTLAKPVKVLEGEASGHIHNLHGQAVFYRATEMGLELGTIAVGRTGATVKHQKSGKATGEHKDISLPSGRWKVTRQREYRGDREEFVED